MATRSPSIPPCHRAASAGSSNSILCICPFSMFYNIYLCFLCVIVMVLEIALPVAWSIGQSVIKLDPLCLTKTFCLRPHFVINTMFFCYICCSCLQMISSNKEQTRFKAEIRGVGRVGSWSWRSNIWGRISESQNDAS